jgi:hypothetical protein
MLGCSIQIAAWAGTTNRIAKNLSPKTAWINKIEK